MLPLWSGKNSLACNSDVLGLYRSISLILYCVSSIKRQKQAWKGHIFKMGYSMTLYSKQEFSDDLIPTLYECKFSTALSQNVLCNLL